MLRLLVVASLAVAIQAIPLSTSKSPSKIVGGNMTTIDKVPWQVAIEVNNFYYCGGSIISANYILTTAFCVHKFNTTITKIRSGSTVYENWGTLHQVDSMIVHPEYRPFERDYDVAVIKLSEPLTLDENQQAVSLRKEEASAGEAAQIAGWGITDESGRPPTDLQVVQVPVVARDECSAAYNDLVTEGMICAGTAGKDSCQGDYGGALTIDSTQVGIYSFGAECGDAAYPHVYTNVPAYADFINEKSNHEAVWV